MVSAIDRHHGRILDDGRIVRHCHPVPLSCAAPSFAHCRRHAKAASDWNRRSREQSVDASLHDYNR
jgi:hypothetical protein